GHDLSMERFSGDPDRCDHGKTERISHPTDRVHDITLLWIFHFFCHQHRPRHHFNVSKSGAIRLTFTASAAIPSPLPPPRLAGCAGEVLHAGRSLAKTYPFTR